MSEDIEWEDPPPDGRSHWRSGFEPKLAELKKHPDKWARLQHFEDTTAVQRASALKRGEYKWLGDLTVWEFKGRRNPNGAGSVLYGRYIGNGGD